MDRRGVTPVVGFVILVGIAAIGAMSLFVAGLALADATQSDAEQQQVERSLAQFAETADELATSESQDRTFTIDGADGGAVSLDEDAGHIRIVLDNGSDTRNITDTDLGALKYERDDGTIAAYQGGGVWRSEDSGATMIRPPDFHYRAERQDGATLTFPLVRLSGETGGDNSIEGSLAIEEERTHYPKANDTNPLEGGEVYVEIESEYCEAWESHLGDRTDSEVEERCSGDGTHTDVGELRFKLVVPSSFTLGEDQAVLVPGEVTNPGGAKAGGGGSQIHGESVVRPGQSFANDISTKGATYVTDPPMPNRTDELQDHLDYCNDGDKWDDELKDEHTHEPGIHCIKNFDNLRDVDPTGAEMTIDASNGKMTYVVRDSFDDGDGGIEIEGDDKVQFFIADDVLLDSKAKKKDRSTTSFGNPTDPQQTEIIVDGDLEMTGQGRVHGIVFASGTVGLEAQQEIIGAVLSQNLTVTGQAEIVADHDGKSIEIESEDSDGTTVYYLHVSETVMSVEEN